MMMRKIQPIACLLCLAACTSTTKESPPQGRTLIEYMNDTRDDYAPLSATEMTNHSEVIVRGFLSAVRDGRVADFATGPSNPTQMAVIEVTVTETIKGPEGRDHVYFEYVRGGATPERIGAHLPVDELLLFLNKPQWDTKTYRFDEPDRGLPAGETLYSLVTQQSMLMESEGVVSQPLEPGPPGSNAQLFGRISLDEAEAQIRALVTDSSKATP